MCPHFGFVLLPGSNMLIFW